MGTSCAEKLFTAEIAEIAEKQESSLRPLRALPMMTRRAAAGMLFGAVLAGGQTPRAGPAILEAAKRDARRSGRAIFATFHASW